MKEINREERGGEGASVQTGRSGQQVEREEEEEPTGGRIAEGWKKKGGKTRRKTGHGRKKDTYLTGRGERLGGEANRDERHNREVRQ